MAAKLGYDRSVIAKAETGERPPSPDVAAALQAELFPNGPDGLVGRLAALARRHDGPIPSWFESWLEAEAKAHALKIWQPLIVPGLFQTSEYARALFVAAGEEIERADELVTARLERHTVLDRPKAPHVVAVLDEAVLHRLIGTPAVMHDQLTHLAELADRLNIILRILPLDAQHTVLGPAFVTFRFGPPTDALLPDIAASEQLKSIVIVEDERHVHLHRLVFEALDNESLSPAKSSALILEAAESWWSAPRATAIGSEVRRSTRPRDS